MMFRGDQHVDDWAEVAVDYLDGRLDQETRLAVETHLAACPDCAARLHRQQYVVRFVQETELDDPPEDLEYRAIGEIIFPSPGGTPIAPPVQVEKRTRAPRWYRTLRAWIPATVAVVALLAAVVGYGIAKSNSGAELTADSQRSVDAVTTLAASATTAAPATTAGAATLAGAAETMTTAAAATTTSVAVASGPPVTGQAPATFEATQDRRAMIQAIETAQTPAFVSFRAPVVQPTEAGGGQDSTSATDSSTATSAASATDTTVGSATVTSASTTSPTESAVPDAKVFAPVTEEAAANVVAQLEGFTGLEPLDPSLWLGGPTYAAFLPRKDAEKLVDLVRSIGASLGLVVRLEGGPPAAAKDSSGRLMENKSLLPMLKANRALQPATWGYDFTTSSITRTSDDQGVPTPDEAGTHVVIVIWIAE